MRYYNTVTKNELIPGVHFKDELPANVVELESDHVVFQPLPAGHRLTYGADGLPNGTEEVAETTEAKTALFRSMASEHIEEAARSAGPFGFDSIVTAVSYANDMDDTFNQPHGAALLAFRRDVWDAVRVQLAVWQSGGSEPTMDEFKAALPVYAGV